MHITSTHISCKFSFCFTLNYYVMKHLKRPHTLGYQMLISPRKRRSYMVRKLKIVFWGSQSHFKETFGLFCLYGAKNLLCLATWPLSNGLFKADIPPVNLPGSLNKVFTFSLAIQDNLRAVCPLDNLLHLNKAKSFKHNFHGHENYA